MVDRDDIGWFLRVERELGSMAERHRSLEQSDQHLRAAIEESSARQERSLSDAVRVIAADVARENAHTRGELHRIISEVGEHRRADERRQKEEARKAEASQQSMIGALRSDLEASHAESARVLATNRRIIAAVGLCVVFAQQILDNSPALMRAIVNVLGSD